MTVVHRLVGYDRKTERVAFEKPVPRDLLSTAKEIAHVPASDPDAIYDYELSSSEARDLAGFLGVTIDAEHMIFFLEAFDRQKRA